HPLYAASNSLSLHDALPIFGTIESVRATFGLTETFVGIIVVAIIGNAAEHSSAILMALKNKMDLSVGIAIGSSLQIALFVAPLRSEEHTSELQSRGQLVCRL